MKRTINRIYTEVFAAPEYVLASGTDQQAYGGMVNWKGIIVWTTPQYFLSKVLPIRDFNPHTKERIANLKKKMEQHIPLDPLVLIVHKNDRVGFCVTGHEGRHRAYAALELGIKKVPVLVIPRYDFTDFPRVPNWTPEIRKEIESLNFVKEL